MLMDAPGHILGIDIGSVALAAAEIDAHKQVIGSTYVFHHGDIRGALHTALSSFDLSKIGAIAATSSTPKFLRTTRIYDNPVAVIAACRHFFPRIGSILLVGGERFGVIHFDEEGNYKKFRTNSSCAAGTGSFLDQQARRLNLEGAEELARIALKHEGGIPKIASRCAVFAKTDLVHAQQEGYSLAAICDGLCRGLAKNIVDTLFEKESSLSPIIFAGGVAKNRAVVHHISSILGEEIITDEKAPLFGALGAAFSLVDEPAPAGASMQLRTIEDVLIRKSGTISYAHPPLELTLSSYPEFTSEESYHYQDENSPRACPIEVDVYARTEPGTHMEAYLGVDIGSTSTKAIVYLTNETVLAAFYTRTAGRPIDAVQEIMSAIADMMERRKVHLTFLGAGTTGSGRKFIGNIIGADLIIDEITAHARAAVHIRPDADTIIEIGGQDSKFTTLGDGMVTFSTMNTVCAAGTGSFIEEQAQKLNCPLSEYADRAEHRKSPVASDRCTVFMERDLNYYLGEGYSRDEVLASVLHSIRENYLTKVATEGMIGDCILFQGATAKNRALVAAFEARLKKPIHVSRYCHVTGALGVALMLQEERIRTTSFRGMSLIGTTIPVRSEVCDLCTNHCKITIAEIEGAHVAYGFLCGRDYETKRYVARNRSGFDLMKARKKITSVTPPDTLRDDIVIGIPAALYLKDDLPFWKKFFAELSIRTITSEEYRTAVIDGKRLAGAEFCAPLEAMHGHVDYLLGKADFVFLPFYMEQKTDDRAVRRHYCYYTQFAPTLAAAMADHRRDRLLMPLVHYLYSGLHTKGELYRTLKPLMKGPPSYFEISSAYEKATVFKQSCLEKFRKRYREETAGKNEMHVVFLGRPYTMLDESMNKRIPAVFESLGIKAFYQDMLSSGDNILSPIAPLLREFHWHYAAQILEASRIVAASKDAYPVFVTSFRCSPDSFVIEYFKKIMESHGKPYLILQLDEHDSNVGYETRIEAAVRSFRNHHAKANIAGHIHYRPALIPSSITRLNGKTLIFPNWDALSLKLLMVCLRQRGIDARLLEESEGAIQESLHFNTGQCIPLNIIAMEFIDYVRRHNLDPCNTALWMMDSVIPCNLRLFRHHIKNLCASYGNGMEQAAVYAGGLSMADLSLKVPLDAYFAFMFGGLLRKMGCRIRPYETIKGATDRVIDESIAVFSDAFRGKCSKEEAVAEVVSLFEAIETSNGNRPRPKVAIFGDLYARDNEVMNQHLIHFIEEQGGEVITTPYSSYVKMITGPYFRKWFFEGRLLEVLSSGGLITLIKRLEDRYLQYFNRILPHAEPAYDEPSQRILSKYHMRIEHTGESMDNILKIFYLLRHYPDLSLFVQTSPAFCCPSLVTEAMANRIEAETVIPIVSITYDGTGGNKNNAITPYLTFPRRLPAKRDDLRRAKAVS